MNAKFIEMLKIKYNQYIEDREDSKAALLLQTISKIDGSKADKILNAKILKPSITRMDNFISEVQAHKDKVIEIADNLSDIYDLNLDEEIRSLREFNIETVEHCKDFAAYTKDMNKKIYQAVKIKGISFMGQFWTIYEILTYIILVGLTAYIASAVHSFNIWAFVLLTISIAAFYLYAFERKEGKVLLISLVALIGFIFLIVR